MCAFESCLSRGLRAALFLSLCLLAIAGAPAASPTVEARLESRSTDGSTEVSAYAVGGPLAAARYELKSEKMGTVGRSTTRQSGTFKLSCCEPVALARLSLGVATGDQYTITLKVFDGDTLLDEQTLLYPQ